jgi:LmbE family N-acetylglucosaminyl deacetylase
MQAVALVAHPDDCVIFAWPFIEAHPEFEWTIVYMTYRDHDPRAREIRAYWDKRGITTVFMGYKDDYLDQQTGKFNFWEPAVVGEHVGVNVEVHNPVLILTHNADGDYGHIHHMFVNQIANSIDKPKVYFASTFNYNTEYVVQTPANADELPLHKKVIEEFTDRNIGRYFVTPEAELILKEKQ